MPYRWNPDTEDFEPDKTDKDFEQGEDLYSEIAPATPYYIRLANNCSSAIADVDIGGGNSGTTQRQSGWAAQSSGTSTKLNSVFFIDSNYGWTCGNDGVIFATTDGGTTWTAQTSGTSNNLNSIFFVSATTGWVCGDVGTILKTTDGGTTWTAQTSGVLTILNKLYFTDSNTGWACGASGVVRYTLNSGTTWKAGTSGISSNISSIFFVSATTGWFVGDSGVVRNSTDGGLTWSAQTSGILSNLNNVFFTDIDTGWTLGDSGVILKTINRGGTWTAQTSGTSNALYGIYFSDGNHGWATGISGTILKTISGGTTWTADSSGTTNNLLGIRFILNGYNGWTVGSAGTILVSATARVFTSQNENFTYSIPVNGFNYNEIINSIITKPFTVRQIFIFWTGSGQVDPVISVIKDELMGGISNTQVFSPAIDPNQVQTDRTRIVIDVIGEPIEIDGATTIRIGEIGGSVTFNLQLFPQKVFKPIGSFKDNYRMVSFKNEKIFVRYFLWKPTKEKLQGLAGDFLQQLRERKTTA